MTVSAEESKVPSDSESIEMPKSHSIPNRTWREPKSDDEMFDDLDSDN